jgi:putative SOS response-associated peptidase YedK
MSAKTLAQLADEYQAEVIKDFEWKPHVFPRYLAPVIIERKGIRQIVPMHFGLIPGFEMNAKPKMVFHNARSETLKEKPSFKKAYQESRCLIPLESFFEYVWKTDPETRKEKSQLIQFSGSSLTAAGIWSLWRNPESAVVTANFSMITREATELILSKGHDRCPYFLKPEAYSGWLDPQKKDPVELDQFLLDSFSNPLLNVPTVS